MKNAIKIMLLLISNFTFCQDIIYKNDKSEIKAKVLEIEDQKVKYKLFDFLDGPTYNIDKKEIFMIIYKNGKKEVFTNKSTAVEEVKKPVQTENAFKIYTTNNNQSQNTINKTTEETDFYYAPSRLNMNFIEGFDFSLTGSIEGFNKKAMDKNASTFNYLNFGLQTTLSTYSDDVTELFVSDIVVYASWYFPINKLSNKENINIGFFPYTYFGGVLRNTRSSIDTGFSSLETNDWTGDIALGIGLDYKFSRGFGLTFRYDLDYKMGVGINFNF